MADIVLAEYNGQAWMVGGVDHIDDMLANTLPDNVSIEIVICESNSEINELWERYCGEPVPGTMPWAIHPGIVKRIRRQSTGHSVFFEQWSANLDRDAMEVIRGASNWAMQFEEAEVHLVAYAREKPGRAARDLANLRSGLIEEELEKLGIVETRFVRVTRDAASLPAVGEEAQRIDIEIKRPETEGG